MGRKARGLASLDAIVESRGESLRAHGFDVDVPALAVLGADLFDVFLDRNGLRELERDGASDDVIRDAFRRAKLPAEFTGDLWALASEVRVPLAVRSSSILEDAAGHPLAGVYGTKMIPGSQPGAEARFAALVDAVKFVYASTLFSSARSARAAAGLSTREERMAVIVQEVVGLPRGERFYPDVSAVLRSIDVYASGAARPEEGVAILALGLGKTIVDGGLAWPFSPAHPRARPPFGSTRDILAATQTRFWAVNTGRPPAYDPMAETEFLVQSDLDAAEADGVLARVASTYDPSSDRVVPGIGRAGPRVLDFAPLLFEDRLPRACEALLAACEEASGEKVELEVAFAFPRGERPRLRLLQMRPILTGAADVEVTDAELEPSSALVVSRAAMGHGVKTIADVVFVERERFELARTREIAEELTQLNASLTAEGRPYLLVVFGRLGTADPWLGIPVRWEGITGAGAIVEAALPALRPDPSQGSHFFHNLVACGAAYLTVPLGGRVDWDVLEGLETVTRTAHVRHVRAPRPILVKVDGRSRRGVVRWQDEEP